ncbi:MAG: hypothetical protein AAF705_19905, partial [Bacteroidota bacterium]
MHIILVDNYDSFTYNLYDYLLQTGVVCTVIRNDEPALLDTISLSADGVVLSPGPSRPDGSGQLLEVLRRF